METRQRRSITDDYKRQAVDLVASSGRSIGFRRHVEECGFGPLNRRCFTTRSLATIFAASGSLRRSQAIGNRGVGLWSEHLTCITDRVRQPVAGRPQVLIWDVQPSQIAFQAVA
jgi:hypothetical protein